MTTKPRHTTSRKRHGASDRLNHRLSEQDRLERELRDALRGMDGPASDAIPKSGIRLRTYTVVLFTVRKDGGLPRRWEFLAPVSVWTSEAEHLARAEAKRLGLVVHAHIDTFTEQRP